MKLSALVQEARYVQTTQGVSEAARQFDDLARAQEAARRAMELAARQTDIQERSVTRLGPKLDAYTAKHDPLAKALRDVERGEALVAAARARGIEVTQAHLGALDKARERHERLSGGLNDNAKAAGLARHEWINLSRQMQDVGVSLAGGQNPLTVLLAQGSQIGDIFSSSRAGAGAAVKEFGLTVLRYAVNPLTLAAAAAAATALSFVRWKEQTDALIISLNGVGSASGQTLDQVNRLAEEGAGLAGISNASARGLAGQFLNAGVPGSAIGGAIGLTSDFSHKLGVGVEDIGKELASAFAEPAKGADDLARRYGLVSFAEREHIKELAAVGERSAAAAELLQILSKRLGELEDPTWRVTKLWEAAKKGFWNGVDKFGETIDRSIQGGEGLASQRAERANRAAEAERRAKDDRAAERANDLNRLREDATFAVREISARTFAEREALSTQRAWTSAMRETHDAVKASIAAESERAKMLAEAARKSDDMLRSARDQNELSRLSPFERAMREIDFKYRDAREQLLPSALNTTADAAQNLTSALNTAANAVAGPFKGRLIPFQDWRGGDELSRAREAIASIESGGAYSAIGPRTRAGDRAYGRYQVMGRNIGPWTMDAFGQALSPSRFLASPAAQDAVFNRQFAASMARYGNMNDAASVWFTGRPLKAGANARDILGTSGARYVENFDSALGRGPIGETLDKAEAEERGQRRYELIRKPLKDANLEIERQRALLNAQADALGRSSEETARAAKQQELYNQFAAQGVNDNTIGKEKFEELRASIAATAENYGRLTAETESFADKQRLIVGVMDTIRSGASEGLGGVASALIRSENAGKALENTLQRVSERLAQLAIDRSIEGLLGRGGQAGGGVFGGLLSGLFGGGGGRKYFSAPLFGGFGKFFGFDEGGVVGRATRRSFFAPASAFIGAPHFAGGGIVGGARPIIAHDGERILNAAQQGDVAGAAVAAAAIAAARGSANNNRGDGQSAPVYVNIQNAPAGARVRESTDARGGKRIDISFPEMMARSMGDPRVMEALRSANGGAGIVRKW